MRIKGIKWYWWLVIIFIPLMVGIGWGSASKERVVTKEVPVVKEVPVTKEVVKECDYTNWKSLKSKDDEIITVSDKGFIIVSEIFNAISQFDMNTIEKKTAELEGLSNQMSKLAPERQAILQNLGY